MVMQIDYYTAYFLIYLIEINYSHEKSNGLSVIWIRYAVLKSYNIIKVYRISRTLPKLLVGYLISHSPDSRCSYIIQHHENAMWCKVEQRVAWDLPSVLPVNGIYLPSTSGCSRIDGRCNMIRIILPHPMHIQVSDDSVAALYINTTLVLVFGWIL